MRPWLAGGVLALCACAPAPPVAPEALDETARRAIYERVDRVFGHGELWSPADDSPTGAVLEMAPLLIREVGAQPAQSGDALEVRAFTSQIELRGEVCSQRTYYWHRDRAEGAPPIQGIRMTFGADGFPWIYEVLGDTAGVRTLFVTTALEAAASAEFGAPLPGRSFALERALAEADDVIVAGVLEPGPMPLGPFVYLTSDDGDVSTVICRCMPSQVGSIDGNSSYRLIQLPTRDDAVPDALPAARLEGMLRLPAVFSCG